MSKNNYKTFLVEEVDIRFFIDQGKKVPTKYFVMLSLTQIKEGVPYKLILARIQRQYGVSPTYDAFCTSISRYVNGKQPNLKSEEPTNQSKLFKFMKK